MKYANENFYFDIGCSDAEKLNEISEMLNLAISEIKQILRNHPNTYNRAKAYFLGYVEMSISNDHDYVGEIPFTLQDAIDEVDSTLCGDEDEDEDEDDEDDK